MESPIHASAIHLTRCVIDFDMKFNLHISFARPVIGSEYQMSNEKTLISSGARRSAGAQLFNNNNRSHFSALLFSSRRELSLLYLKID